MWIIFKKIAHFFACGKLLSYSDGFSRLPTAFLTIQNPYISRHLEAYSQIHTAYY